MRLNVQAEPTLQKSDTPPAKGVDQGYKDIANKSANVMWRAKIKGHTQLDDNIPLHMSLKTFDNPHKMPIEEVHKKVKELNIQRPDPTKLGYHADTFKSPRSGRTYYMLHIHGADPSHKKFNEHFKGQGITHDKFMSHITINKDLYDKIKKEGLHPNEVEFSPLMIEHGPNNPTHIYEDNQSHKDHLKDFVPKKSDSIKKTEKDLHEKLEKASLKHIGAGLAIAGALATSGMANKQAAPKAPIQQSAQAPKQTGYSSKKMLNAISQVETSGGRNLAHSPVQGSMHGGEKAYGRYGLMPQTIRETISANKDLKTKHGKATKLSGQDFHNYMRQNPSLEGAVAERHLKRLEHHFGQNPEHIGYAWLNGVTGTHRDIKNKKDISNHWHVKKIKSAYTKE